MCDAEGAEKAEDAEKRRATIGGWRSGKQGMYGEACSAVSDVGCPGGLLLSGCAEPSATAVSWHPGLCLFRVSVARVLIPSASSASSVPSA